MKIKNYNKNGVVAKKALTTVS